MLAVAGVLVVAEIVESLVELKMEMSESFFLSSATVWVRVMVFLTITGSLI